MISTDRNIFDEQSAVRMRMVDYGKLFDELHIVVFSQKKPHVPIKVKISENVFAYPTNSFNRWFYIWGAYRLGKKIIKKSKDFIVTVQDPFETGFAGWLISSHFGLGLNLQVHTDFLSSYFVKDSFLNKVRVQIAKFLLTQANSIRVVSERVKHSLVTKLKIPEQNIMILPIFTDAHKIKATPAVFSLHEKYTEFDFIILMVGRLEKEKNFPLALKAFSFVVDKHPKTGLVIVGVGSELDNLREKASELGVQSNVVFEGWQDHLISYYKTADLFLCTSNYEGYGMALIEAAISGCPIVSTNVGVLSYVFKNENSALICNPGDLDCLVAHLLLAREGEKLRFNLKEQAKKALEDNILSKEEYLERYKNVILNKESLTKDFME